MTLSAGLLLRASNLSDLAAIKALLSECVLPTADLDNVTAVRFWIAEENSTLVGTIGLEPFGAAGLLRSLAIAPAYRGRGIGVALVHQLEREARARGVQFLVLLTETARPFFSRLGYHVV